MNNNVIIAVSWLAIILLATTTGMAIQPYLVNDIDEDLSNNATYGYRIDFEPVYTVGEYEVEYVEIREITTYDILQLNGFDSWSIEDKEILTLMMAVTVNPSYSNDSFVEIIENAPKHVLETYIDLLEHAGY